MLEKILYKTSATSTGGRDGQASTADGTMHVWLGMPRELGGNSFGNNPEQLFALGYSACFLSAIKNVVRTSNYPKIPDSTKVTATVGIGPKNAKAFGLDIQLSVEMPGIEKTIAEAIVAEAHEVCPYSNAVRGNVNVVLSVI